LEFDNSFEVPLPPAEAWAVLMDIRRIAPCMPGAELTEVVDEKNYKGKVAVRLGPVALAFAGLVTFEEIDNANRTARVKAQGTDSKGRGGANATASFRIDGTPTGGSKVLVHTDLALSGSVAQYGRGVGLIQATAAQIMTQFANNLKAQIARETAVTAAPPLAPGSEGIAATSQASPQVSPQVSPQASPPPAAKPISGFSLMAKVIWASILKLFGRSAA
jgi:carbon monoxide dehydrogenase subunit G